ncbi:MAG TPA: peptidoglycan DD-metalloendopeptidase family protein [Candidatus Paceibacterota bacterium]|nr:peptidoglycan DD-metalloendopeptidase family protein [Candidatus Paceibacterota bacterium]
MRSSAIYTLVAACASLVLIIGGSLAQADSSASSTAANLQSQIDQNNQQINALNQEIAQYQTQLDATSKQRQSLQTTINQINLSIKKTTTSIQVTQKQINNTQLQISQLAQGISNAQDSISKEQQGLAQAMQRLDEADQQPLFVSLLMENGISGVWNDIDTNLQLQSAVGAHIQSLATQKQVLTNTKTAQETKKTQLLQQQQMLQTEQGSLAATRAAQNQLLVQTKNKEANYQALIAQKQAQAAQLQQALTNLKAQYNQAVNPNQITPAAPGILQWPIAGKITITQYFGNTPFADAHAPLYSGHGHDGLDIAAPIGTPVHAALSGVILATGNTDAVAGCYSFGKWVMIKHDNGLNTMYAHLSQISVSAGQQVSTGDVIGFSGETGYATGPHLHFGVYVSSVTQIIPLGQATKGTAPCSRAVMPVPPVSGYLNPLNYLPSL